jgi:MTH538 TIR-like domain (DUF1863)
MARSVFFSFHYQRDISRVNVVRNHMMTKGGYHSAGYWDHSLWETVKKEGDLAIRRMINKGLENTSVTAVLVGAETADRPWVKYEIEKSLERGNGVIGIYLNNIRNLSGQTDLRGKNPFGQFYATNTFGARVYASQIYPIYDWSNDDGYNKFSVWIEQAARAAGK